MKKLLSFVLALSLLLPFSGCSPAVLYQDEDVKVSLMDLESLPEIFMSHEWVPIDDKLAYGSNELIIEGTVSNVREIVVDYRYMDADISSYLTLIDLSVTDILYTPSGSSLKIGDSISISFPYNTYTHSEGLPVISNDSEVIIFCTSCSKLKDDALKRSSYVQYWCGAPNYLYLEKADGFYFTHQYFTKSFTEESNQNLSNVSEIKLPVSEHLNTILRGRYRRDIFEMLNHGLLAEYVLLESEELKDAISQKALYFNGDE